VRCNATVLLVWPLGLRSASRRQGKRKHALADRRGQQGVGTDLAERGAQGGGIDRWIAGSDSRPRTTTSLFERQRLARRPVLVDLRSSK
jgi:hypothetical protein